MKLKFNRFPEEIQNYIFLVSRIAEKSGVSVYLVGGFVRDLILGVENFDLDFVVEGDAIKIAEEFLSSVKARLVRHKRFGTATIILGAREKIDFSSSRKEFYPHPGSLPVVKCGTLREDLFRRDFTINAMAISLNKDSFGRLIDYFNGRDDLRDGSIRILHDLSFIDDPTRIIRAVRFEKRYNFRIEKWTLNKLKESVRLKMLDEVEPQRVRDDLILLLKEGEPLKYIRRLNELTGLKFIHPTLAFTNRGYCLIRSMERQISWFRRRYPHRRRLDIWLMYLLAILDPLGLKESKEICFNFALRKGERKRILSFKKIYRQFSKSFKKKNIASSKLFDFLEPLSYETILMLMAKYKDPILRGHIRKFFDVYNGMRINISGHDLHKLGITPGPDYRDILTKVLKAKVDGLVRDKEEELVFVKRLLKIK